MDLLKSLLQYIVESNGRASLPPLPNQEKKRKQETFAFHYLDLSLVARSVSLFEFIYTF